MAKQKDMPDWMKRKIKRQKDLSKKQGGYKYIAPVLGKRVDIGVNQKLWEKEHYAAHKYYSVEFYKWDKLG